MTSLLEQFGISSEQASLLEIFHKYSLEKISAAISKSTRFVHYTTAETALRLITTGEAWLRKTAHMNDFMEVEHGFQCLSNSYRKHKEEVQSCFESMFPGISQKIEDHFNDLLPFYRTRTYLSCVSEHDDDPRKNEDSIGRLSMWRAYGGRSGVAIVMNGGVFHRPVESDALKAYVSPVAYLDEGSFDSEFCNFLDRVKNNQSWLISLGEESFFHRIANTFQYSTLCTKHPGFFEEREWRIVYNPVLGLSSHIREDIETVAGIPQLVCKLPLQNRPDLGILGLAMNELIDRVIIGPSMFPYEIREALVQRLKESGVDDAERKVVVSDIPLRQI